MKAGRVGQARQAGNLCVSQKYFITWIDKLNIYKSGSRTFFLRTSYHVGITNTGNL